MTLSTVIVGDCRNAFAPLFPLIICDPPYGKIVKRDWDVPDYDFWMRHCVEHAFHDATVCMWGGIGKPGDGRPFLKFAATVEDKFPGWRILNLITWSKKRAYGTKTNYLFTREECLVMVRGNPVFNVPLTDKERGYAGYNKEYPALSKFLRRTNVWTDITEIFRGKIHETQKPDRLYEVLVEAHSKPGDNVYDPCCGSGTTARAAQKTGRGYFIVDRIAEPLIKAGLI